MKKVVIMGLLLFSGLAQSYPSFNTVKPDLICVSHDSNWRLQVYLNQGKIKVFDVNQDRLAHEVDQLTDQSDAANAIYRLENHNKNHALPDGIIFEADLNVAEDNAFGIDDYSGKETIYTCGATRGMM